MGCPLLFFWLRYFFWAPYSHSPPLVFFYCDHAIVTVCPPVTSFFLLTFSRTGPICPFSRFPSSHASLQFSFAGVLPFSFPPFLPRPTPSFPRKNLLTSQSDSFYNPADCSVGDLFTLPGFFPVLPPRQCWKLDCHCWNGIVPFLAHRPIVLFPLSLVCAVSPLPEFPAFGFPNCLSECSTRFLEISPLNGRMVTRVMGFFPFFE